MVIVAVGCKAEGAIAGDVVGVEPLAVDTEHADSSKCWTTKGVQTAAVRNSITFALVFLGCEMKAH